MRVSEIIKTPALKCGDLCYITATVSVHSLSAFWRGGGLQVGTLYYHIYTAASANK